MNKIARTKPYSAGFIFLLVTVLTACNLLPSLPPRDQSTSFATRRKSVPSQTLVPSPSATFTPTAIATSTATATTTATATASPTPTDTPTITPTPTDTLTPTPSVPFVTAKMRAFCRYGPGRAYLYSYELKQGAQAVVEGRNASSTWLWLQPPDLNRHCWASAVVLDIFGNLDSVPVVQTKLPRANNLYGPPQNVHAERDGNIVTVTWDPVWMTEDDDRGYLIEAFVCQDNALRWVAAQTYETSYEFTDEPGCSHNSHGQIYTVEKHGYIDPVPIPWP